MAFETKNEVVDEYHKLYHSSHIRTWCNTFWLGVPALKCPLDLWIYQEIIHERCPDLIIETGTANGGSTLFLASICDLVNNGRILTIDLEEREGRPRHKRITYLCGSSTAPDVVEKVVNLKHAHDEVMVILDSDHSRDHVLSELRIYSRFVTTDNYLIVEDTDINGHPVLPDFGPGPMEAVDLFLNETQDFIVDQEREKFFLTFNPRGYLRKIR